MSSFIRKMPQEQHVKNSIFIAVCLYTYITSKYFTVVFEAVNPFSLQKNFAWISSAGATWFPNMVFVTTSSMDSSAASPAPARSHRTQTFEGPQRPAAMWVFFLEYLTSAFCIEERDELCRCSSAKNKKNG